MRKQKESKKMILTMLFLVVVLAIIVLFLYIPKEMSYESLDCKGLYKEKILIVDLANYCLNDEDCKVVTDFVSEGCNCYEIINKNEDINQIKNRIDEVDKLYNEKNCSEEIPTSCAQCLMPSEESIKCINRKCVEFPFPIDL